MLPTPLVGAPGEFRMQNACVLVENLAEGATLTMPAGTIKRIHVNQHIIRANKKTGARDNVVTIQWRGKSYRVRRVNISGTSDVLYAPDRPLSCGAHVWVETTAEVRATV